MEEAVLAVNTANGTIYSVWMLLALMIPWLAELLCLILLVMRINWRALHDSSSAMMFSCLKEDEWKHPPQFLYFCFFILQKKTMDVYRREVTGHSFIISCPTCMYYFYHCYLRDQRPPFAGDNLLRMLWFGWQCLWPTELSVSVFSAHFLPLQQAGSSSHTDVKEHWWLSKGRYRGLNPTDQN